MRKKNTELYYTIILHICPTDDAAERTAAVTKREGTAEGSQISWALEDESEP